MLRFLVFAFAIPILTYDLAPDGLKVFSVTCYALVMAAIANAFGDSPSGGAGKKAGSVYVIQDKETGLYKIGRTTNLERRLKELGVGKTARLINSKKVEDAAATEKKAHKRYKSSRLPQTEYFKLQKPPQI